MCRRAWSQAFGAMLMLAVALLASRGWAQPGPGRTTGLQFRTHTVIDQQQGNLVMGTLTVPAQWQVSTHVQWTYADVSLPLRTFIRAEAPDRSAWVEFFPVEIFSWLEPVPMTTPVGARNLGMIHVPNVDIRQAMQHFVVNAYRAQPSLRVVSTRSVDPARLAAVFGQPATPGDALGARLNYVANGQPVEEDIYGLLGKANRIPYTGRQGTSYENQRVLVYVHALGATNGQLDSVYPLLTFIAGSLKVDPSWEAHRQRVYKAVSDAFNRNVAQGYSVIDAAGATSRMISAGNDAMLNSMQAQRQAQAQRDAQLRASARARGPNDSFSQYLRGTERMKDPYWGESERSYHQRYHWTDGHGNYRSSNDASFNPNVGAGGGVNWQRMEPAR
ncbi:MAG TPA: hypothetical protein VNE58_08940 [Casimicrobiaceae bacterium]|nr:hypothetical protein [Casimicrobiaceae bacterium]